MSGLCCICFLPLDAQRAASKKEGLQGLQGLQYNNEYAYDVEIPVIECTHVVPTFYHWCPS